MAFRFVAAVVVLGPAAAQADLFICINNGRLAIRQQPAGSCTKLLVPAAKRDRDERQTRSGQTQADDAATSLRYVQTRLAELGYRPGPADGIMGRRTRRAIQAFQKNAGLSGTGRVDAELVDALRNAR